MGTCGHVGMPPCTCSLCQAETEALLSVPLTLRALETRYINPKAPEQVCVIRVIVSSGLAELRSTSVLGFS